MLFADGSLPGDYAGGNVREGSVERVRPKAILIGRAELELENGREPKSQRPGGRQRERGRAPWIRI